MVTAIFVNYSGGRHTLQNKQILIQIETVNDEKKAAQYIGKKVRWQSPSGTIFVGKILNVRGGNGVLKAVFKKGLPGQAIGQELTVN